MKINSFDEYQNFYKRSINNPELFWEEIAKQFYWRKRWNETLNWDFSEGKSSWFIGGKLNITENIFDHHLSERKDKHALIWEPNNPNEGNRTLTYEELFISVNKIAKILKDNNVSKGDVVALYMPLIPEAVIVMLACARIGAVHTAVFAGFSAQALSERLVHSKAKVIFTANELLRGEKTLNLKAIVDQAISGVDSVKKVFVFKRTNSPCRLNKNKDIALELFNNVANTNIKDFIDAEELDSSDPLFILYTSGSTGKPKGIVHGCGGYMVYTKYSFVNVFNFNQGDIFWCTADTGWITGHSYLTYGPLLAGATIVLHEGVPTYPSPDIWWKIVDKHKVTHFYTAPTAIRTLQQKGTSWTRDCSLNSLKVLGCVGEPIDEEAWNWYNTHIGKSKCAITDTWWQTETGGIMIAPLASITPTKPCFATLPLPGIQPCILDESGKEIFEPDKEGYLCIKFPWPSQLLTTLADHEHCKKIYFSRFNGYYFSGDAAKRDSEGNFRILGRVDDVINISGHRLGSAEIENSINMHPHAVESAVIGVTHPIKGESISAFIVLQESDVILDNEKILTFNNEIINQLVTQIGSFARPEKIYLVPSLPKTRSGKIMRRLLKSICELPAESRTSKEALYVSLGDLSTLLDITVVEKIISVVQDTSLISNK
jgi:acetyl-CoA synthetase